MTAPGAQTDGYAPPENDTNEKSDIYSFGIMLWEVRGGEPAGKGSSTVQVNKWLKKEVVKGWGSALSELLLGKKSGAAEGRHAGALSRALEGTARRKQPKLRPADKARPSAVQLVAALEAV